jgi:hypothetical protein
MPFGGERCSGHLLKLWNESEQWLLYFVLDVSIALAIRFSPFQLKYNFRLM